MPKHQASAQDLLRNLPSVDELIRSAVGQAIAERAGEKHLAALARQVIAGLRRDAAMRGSTGGKQEVLTVAIEQLGHTWSIEEASRTTRVINATGVIIHTNLGRAPLSDAAREAIINAAGYCTLEYDLSTGRRGRRGRRTEDLLAELTGAEDALVVNNCAAAAFFVLTVFASGGEVIVSRGELVEIGGDFRVPDVLSQSGARLREVGTTNRTKLADYERAVRDTTKVILRVHPSNYRIVGFTARPSVTELGALARKRKLLLYEDAGSGVLSDPGSLRLRDEPVVRRSIKDGAHVVTFSGDKMLGGPQAGIIVGRKKYIDLLRKHPLYRALRVDKITNAALEATLESHRRGLEAVEVPVVAMLSATAAEIERRVDGLIRKLRKRAADPSLTLTKISGHSAVGGGAAPEVSIETWLIAVEHRGIRATKLETLLRSSDPPIIARVVDGRVVLDLRTVGPAEEADLIKALLSVTHSDPRNPS